MKLLPRCPGRLHRRQWHSGRRFRHNPLGWKAHGDGGADADFALQILGSAVQFDQGIGERQTKAGPFMFTV